MSIYTASKQRESICVKSEHRWWSVLAPGPSPRATQNRAKPRIHIFSVSRLQKKLKTMWWETWLVEAPANGFWKQPMVRNVSCHLSQRPQVFQEVIKWQLRYAFQVAVREKWWDSQFQMAPLLRDLLRLIFKWSKWHSEPKNWRLTHP